MKSQSMNWSRKLLKASVLVAGAAMTMGNQKCEKKPTDEAPVRALRKIVELGAIRSSPLIFPDGNAFDFQFVANQQIYGVLIGGQDFTLKYNPPIAAPPESVRRGDDGFFNLTKADGHMMKTFAQAAGKDDYNLQCAKTAWCMVNTPQVRLQGSINSFELIGGGGVTIGFTPAGALPTNGLDSIGFNVEFAQLDVSMIATRPLTSKVVAATNVDAKRTKVKVSFALNFGAFSVGPSAYYQTPLAQVTENALTTSVSALNEELKKEEWYTRVLANHDTHLVIVGGSDVKLEPGDQLLVYNEDYYWEGEPCNSRYLGGGAQTGSAVAKIELDWVGDEISRGRVIEQNDENAVIGGKVKLFKFHDPDYVPQAPAVQSGSGAGSGTVSNPAKPGRG